MKRREEEKKRERGEKREKETGKGKVLTRSSRAWSDSVEHADRRVRDRVIERAVFFFDGRCLARERQEGETSIRVMSEVMR